MAARSVYFAVGNGSEGEDKPVPGREWIDPRRVVAHKEVEREPFASKTGFIDRVGDGFLAGGPFLQIDPEHFMEKTFHSFLSHKNRGQKNPHPLNSLSPVAQREGFEPSGISRK
jgi:hypothetical protein